MPTSHHSVFYRLDALPAAKPTASKHCKSPIIYILGLPLYFGMDEL